MMRIVISLGLVAALYESASALSVLPPAAPDTQILKEIEATKSALAAERVQLEKEKKANDYWNSAWLKSRRRATNSRELSFHLLMNDKAASGKVDMSAWQTEGPKHELHRIISDKASGEIVAKSTAEVGAHFVYYTDYGVTASSHQTGFGASKVREGPNHPWKARLAGAQELEFDLGVKMHIDGWRMTMPLGSGDGAPKGWWLECNDYETTSSGLWVQKDKRVIASGVASPHVCCDWQEHKFTKWDPCRKIKLHFTDAQVASTELEVDSIQLHVSRQTADDEPHSGFGSQSLVYGGPEGTHFIFESIHACAGRSSRKETAWTKANQHSEFITTATNISRCGYTQTPVIITSMGGRNHGKTTGSSEVYGETKTGFSNDIYTDQTPQKANGYNWHMNWLALDSKVSGTTDPEKVCWGSTTRGNTAWSTTGAGALTLLVDLSECKFIEEPTIITSMGGSSEHGTTTGSTEIYAATQSSFRNYIYQDGGVTPQLANTHNWHINWLAMPGKSGTKKDYCWGQTTPEVVSSGASWTVTVDISHCGFANIPMIFTSLGGANHWQTTGASEVQTASKSGFKIIIHDASGSGLSSGDKGWHINWVATRAHSPNGAEKATGDPHLKNMRGEAFDIHQTGKMLMLDAPRGASPETVNLAVHADIERFGAETCGPTYITNLFLTGRWIGAPVEIRSGSIAKKGEKSTIAFGLRVGKIWQTSTDLVELSQGTLEPQPGFTVEANTTRQMVLKVNVLTLTVSQPQRHRGEFLDLQVKGVGSLNTEVGGLLGIDDHSGAEAKTPECKLVYKQQQAQKAKMAQAQRSETSPVMKLSRRQMAEQERSEDQELKEELEQEAYLPWRASISM